MAPPKQRDPEASRNALVQAAEEIFLKKGFGNTSLSEIARKAGMTKSLIHHYFGSKEGLWREVKTRCFIQYAHRQTEMITEAQPTAELLRNSLAFYFDFLKHNPQVVRILAWMFLEQDIVESKECMDIDRELIRVAVDKIRKAQDLEHLRKDLDPRFILFVFIGLCQHWFQDKGHFKESFGTEGLGPDLDDAYLTNIIKIFFEGILPQKG